MNSIIQVKRFFAILSILTFLINAFPSGLKAQQVKRGERPPVDFLSVPDSAIEPGVVRIKLQPEHSTAVENAAFEKTATGVISLNIEAIDQLNLDFAVRSAVPTFNYTNKNEQINTRHRQWGFHLWLDLYYDADTDIRQIVQAYNGLAEVEIAEPIYKIELIGNVEDIIPVTDTDKSLNIPNDPGFGQQWHYHNTGQASGTAGADVKLPAAWQIETGKPNVIVAIIDGGIQADHPDLSANMWSGTGYNFVTNSAVVTPHNHGTHVAGTVGAVSNNNIGVSGVAGGSGSGDGVRLMSCQVFTNEGNGGFHLAPVFAADNGATISQNSWGYTNPGVYNQAVLDAIDYFNANGGGDVMDGGITIFAAGNSNSSGNWYPAIYSGAMSVASTNNQDKKAWYSNYGSWIDISAPGGQTAGNTAGGVLSTVINSSYGFNQGTSMACPHVSGVAALVLSKYPGVYEPHQLKEILINSADNHYPQNPDYPSQLGSGRLNAYNALQLASQYSDMPARPSQLQASASGNNQINISWIKNQQQSNVVLAYSMNGVFGSPQQGVNYSQDDEISGGGQVIYAGGLSQYNHTGLQTGEKYFYRAWSVNQGMYSIATPVVSVNTPCAVISSLPYQQQFHQESTPFCWSQADHIGNGQVWKFGTFNGGVAGTGGNYAYLNSDAYGHGNTQNADLISPQFDLSGYTSVTISFTHFFRQSNNPATGTLSYSINNGQSWSTLHQWNSTTANPTDFSLEVPALAGQSQVRLKWNYTGTFSFYWSIDNIALSGTTGGTPNYQLTVGKQGQGTTNPSSGTYTYPGGSQVALTASAASGWSFDKWIINGQNHSNSSTSITINSNTQATAIFTQDPVNYSLTVAHQGEGNTTPAAGTHSYVEGSQVTLSATPAQGWSFDKWVVNGQNISNSATTIVINANTQATAVFTQNPVYYSLNIGIQGQGTTSPSAGTHTFAQGSQVTLSAIAEQGWNFDKWVVNGQNISSHTTTISITANTQATAVFSQEQVYHTLLIEKQGDGNTYPPLGTHSYPEGSQVTLSATPESGWKFDRWIVNGIQHPSNTIVLNVRRDNQAQAIFIEDPAEHEVLIQRTGRGSTQPAPGLYYFKTGEYIQLNANASEGWMFDKWVINGESYKNPRVAFQVNEPQDITAHFVESSFPGFIIFLGTVGTGVITPGEGEYHMNEGQVVQITATPGPGWTFDRWTVNGEYASHSNVFSYAINGNVEILAHFEAATGVSGQDPLADLKVFPNPSRGQVSISGLKQLSNVEVSVADLLGRQHYHQILENNIGNDVISIGSGSLPEGLYIVTIRSDNYTWQERLLISR